MKLFTLLSLLIITTQIQAKNPKYIFFFIGDGMGLGQRSIAEIYKNAQNSDKPGSTPLRMSLLPTQGFVYTHSADSYITDSAAAGTAMAIGKKTFKGGVGVDVHSRASSISLAKLATKNGYKTGIITSVSIDHATPAVFYATDKSRKHYYNIAQQLSSSNIDYFGGGCANGSSKRNKKDRIDPTQLAKESGYTILQSKDEFYNFHDKTKKVWAMDDNCQKGADLPYVIDQKAGQRNLLSYVKKGIELVDNEKGFFFMIEGGKIDWASHANDGATLAREVIDFDDSIEYAYQFYLKHKRDTLIIVTADHETGGLGLGTTKHQYTLYPKTLIKQKISIAAFNNKIAKWKKSQVSFFDKLNEIKTLFGFDSLTKKEYARIRKSWLLTMNPKFQKQKKKLIYSRYEPLSDECIKIVSERTGIGWTTNSHTAITVPISSIGATATKDFSGYMDNTDIYHKLAQYLTK
ncbi:MAG: alkaline phosphatase [Candidatus Cloacimonadota bacterium]|nr:MAG: alkaline phosphatase [Candidatus Cloacimonadota bacterium]